MAAVIPNCCAAHPRDFQLWRWTLAPWRALICAQSRECVGGELRIAFRHFPYQFEKQRKRAWCAFMLQRTMLR